MNEISTENENENDIHSDPFCDCFDDIKGHSSIYTCAVCCKQFHCNEALKKHILSHFVPQTEFICPLRDCGKHLRTEYGFTMHEQEHQMLIDKGLESPSFDFNQYEKNCMSFQIPSSQQQYKLNDSYIQTMLIDCLSRKGYLNHTPCTRLSCKRVQRLYEKGKKQLCLLKQQLVFLENQVKEDDYLSDDDEGEIPVVPIQYLCNEEPYSCGISQCKQQFHTYNELVAHASAHPTVSLMTILNNQLQIPEGRYHCPFPECEYGYGKKSISFEMLRIHFRNIHMYETSMIKHKSLKIVSNSEVDVSSLLAKLRKEKDIYLTGFIYNNGNVVLSTVGEIQKIACKSNRDL